MNTKLLFNIFDQFFPDKNISGAIKDGQNMIKGVDDSLEGVRGYIQQKGITNEQIDKVSEMIRTHPASKMICRVAKVNPMSICNDIKKLKSNLNNTNPSLAPKMAKPKVNHSGKFKRF